MNLLKPIFYGFWALVILTACTPKAFYRTAISDTPCQLSDQYACYDANLVFNTNNDYQYGFIEIDDQGQVFDSRQVNSLLNILKKQSKPQYVVIFVHGWHHDSNETEYNLKRFRDILNGAKLRNPDKQVTGIYIGWRGETINIPVIKWLSFWNRKLVSEEIGHNALLDIFLQIENIVKPDLTSQNRLITIGHSLGATVVFNALQPLLLQRLRESSTGSKVKGFGDMVTLVNPAFEAIRFTTLREAAIQQSNQIRSFQRDQPVLIIANSKNDTITRDLFAWSQKISALFEDHRDFQAINHRPDATKHSQWELDTTAIGHFTPYLTHKLDLVASNNDYQCTTPQINQNINSLVLKETYPMRSSEHINTPLFRLNSLLPAELNQPFWVVQTDDYIFPSHGNISQKHFWCFVDITINETQFQPNL